MCLKCQEIYVYLYWSIMKTQSNLVTNDGREILWFDIVIELRMSKCVPVLYYGSECCPVSKSQFKSLEFALCGSFMKIFNTRSKEIANYCMEMFNVQTPHYTIIKRKYKFLSNIMSSKNVLYEIYREFAENELELCA